MCHVDSSDCTSASSERSFRYSSALKSKAQGKRRGALVSLVGSWRGKACPLCLIAVGKLVCGVLELGVRTHQCSAGV